MVLDKHTHIKTQNVRDNHALFMAKELSEAIMNRSEFKNKYLKWKSCEIFFGFETSEDHM